MNPESGPLQSKPILVILIVMRNHSVSSECTEVKMISAILQTDVKDFFYEPSKSFYAGPDEYECHGFRRCERHSFTFDL